MESNLMLSRQMTQVINKTKDLSIETSSFWLFFIALIITSTKNFLAFHTGVELFSSIIGFGIFTMCVNTYPISKNKFIMILGIGYGFVALADIFHAFTYPGINIFGEGVLQVSSQFWIVARYLETTTLLLSFIVPFKKFKRINMYIVFLGYLLISAFCFLFILVYPFFPNCYIPAIGTTAFKVISEYVISIVLAAIGFGYYVHRDKLDKKLFIYMELNIILTLTGELIFTRYILPNDPLNIIGHFLKVISFYCVYKSVVEQGLNNPYSLLFSNLHEAMKTIEVKSSQIESISKQLNATKSYLTEIEKDILENEIFFDLLIHKSPLTIYAHSEGRFIFANNSAADIYGLESPQELIGRKVLEFVPEEDRVSIGEYINKTYQEIGRVDSLDSRILNTRGEVIDISLSRTIFNYKGKPATLCILWDMSAMKQVEVLKKDAQENKKLLDETLEFNKLIKEFFANLSHELRTPLNVILGALQVIAINNPCEAPELRLARYDKYCKSVKQNCFRLLRLINNLIDMSKIDAGFFSLYLKNQNIVSLVEDITLSVAEYVENKGINLIFDTDFEEKIIACDPDKIERVVLNLLSNAIKFTSPGDEILVSLSDEGDNVTISVKDNGIGIPKEKLDIIFERFRQADSSLSRNQEGSGIGLSLVKSLIEMHGGDISVNSQVDIGTEFIVTIPVKVLEQECDDSKEMMRSSNVERINIEFSDIYS